MNLCRLIVSRSSIHKTITLAGCLILAAHSGSSAWTTASDRRSFLLPVTNVAMMWVVLPKDLATAACMPGDLSPSCIGVYKTPSTITKEQLEQFAPDVKYVPPEPTPQSFRDAMAILQTQRLAADDISTVVTEGRLEEAGIKVLNLVSKLTVAGQVVLTLSKQKIDNSGTAETATQTAVRQLMEQRLDELFEVATVAWKNTDVGIGQSLRGELGATVVAQLRILSDVREASAALDDFLAEVATLY